LERRSLHVVEEDCLAVGELGDRSAEAILIWRPCLNEAVAQRPREQLISRTFVCLPTARARTREYGAVAVHEAHI